MQTVNAVITQALLDIGAVVTGIVGMFSDVLNLFFQEPILIFVLGLAIVGFVIAKVKALI